MTDPIAKELFDILACPVCKGKLQYTADKKDLECKQCKTKYPIEGGIPVIMPPNLQKHTNRIFFFNQILGFGTSKRSSYENKIRISTKAQYRSAAMRTPNLE
jgi:uncharacterized protein YbaR (Trm112 family)